MVATTKFTVKIIIIPQSSPCLLSKVSTLPLPPIHCAITSTHYWRDDTILFLRRVHSANLEALRGDYAHTHAGKYWVTWRIMEGMSWRTRMQGGMGRGRRKRRRCKRVRMLERRVHDDGKRCWRGGRFMEKGRRLGGVENGALRERRDAEVLVVKM